MQSTPVEAARQQVARSCPRAGSAFARRFQAERPATSALGGAGTRRQAAHGDTFHDGRRKVMQCFVKKN